AVSAQQARHGRLARAFAVALGNPEFRTTVASSLQQSRFREGKVHLQGFLSGDGGARRHRLAELAGADEGALAADLDGSAPIEIYLPVPAHRRSWHGEANLLVATAESDHDVPVAFDLQGNRTLLDPARPPVTPVIALERAEQSFTPAATPAGTVIYDEDPNGGGSTGGGCDACGGITGSIGNSPGLYMTYSKFNSTFEGWLKGAPEFEVHILGQDGSSKAMK